MNELWMPLNKLLEAKAGEVLKECLTSVGDEIVFVVGRKKSPGLKEGTQIIVQFKDSRETATDEQIGSLLAKACTFARINGENPGKWRAAINGSELCTRPHIHVQIMFPVGDDKLPPLVESS